MSEAFDWHLGRVRLHLLHHAQVLRTRTFSVYLYLKLCWQYKAINKQPTACVHKTGGGCRKRTSGMPDISVFYSRMFSFSQRTLEHTHRNEGILSFPQERCYCVGLGPVNDSLLGFHFYMRDGDLVLLCTSLTISGQPSGSLQWLMLTGAPGSLRGFHNRWTSVSIFLVPSFLPSFIHPFISLHSANASWLSVILQIHAEGHEGGKRYFLYCKLWEVVGSLWNPAIEPYKMAPLCTYPGLAILHQAIEISNVLINRLIQRQGGRGKQKLKPLVPQPVPSCLVLVKGSHKHAHLSRGLHECLRLPDDVTKALFRMVHDHQEANSKNSGCLSDSLIS